MWVFPMGTFSFLSPSLSVFRHWWQKKPLPLRGYNLSIQKHGKGWCGISGDIVLRLMNQLTSVEHRYVFWKRLWVAFLFSRSEGQCIKVGFCMQRTEEPVNIMTVSSCLSFFSCWRDKTLKSTPLKGERVCFSPQFSPQCGALQLEHEAAAHIMPIVRRKNECIHTSAQVTSPFYTALHLLPTECSCPQLR